MQALNLTKSMAVFLACATLLGRTTSAVATECPLGMPPIPLTQNESDNLAAQEQNASQLAGVRASGDNKGWLIVLFCVGVLLLAAGAAASSGGGSGGS
ncbi:MAG: hypothetical protein WC708_09155 [Lentisphaeria bacterium]